IRTVKAEYEVLAHVVKEDDAQKSTSKTVPAGNLAKVNEETKGDVEAAFKAADAVVEGEYGISVIAHQCLEAHGLVAEWGSDDTLTVWCSTQATTGVAGQLAQQFKIPATKVKCITHYMGGGFGSKFAPGKEGEIGA